MISAYAQLSSSFSQRPKNYKATKIEMNTNDLIYNVVNKDGDVILDVPGIYLVVASPQVNKKGGCGARDIDFWLAFNGQPVADSGIRFSALTPKQTDVIISQGLIKVTAPPPCGHNILNVYMRVLPNEDETDNDKNVDRAGIVYFNPPEPESAIPSIIFTLYKIAELPPF